MKNKIGIEIYNTECINGVYWYVNSIYIRELNDRKKYERWNNFNIFGIAFRKFNNEKE